MKNKLVFGYLLISSLALTGCFTVKNDSSGDFSFEKDSPLIFSEFHRGYSSQDRAIEIYNKGNGEINLGDYSVSIYKQNQKQAYKTIKLSGSLNANETYVLVHDAASESLKAKADLITELMVDGTWPISLNHKDKVVDVLGKIGYQHDYCTYADMARKKEFLVGRNELNEYDWIKYDADNVDLLGTIDVTMSEEELLQGQRLTEEDFARPFVENGSGGGGAIKVRLAYTGDGDTTNFYLDSKDIKGDLSSREIIRYLGINTPEIQHGTSIDAQPWGYAAKKFNNQVINNAKSFAIQTSKGGSYRDAYGRLLGYVWYSNLSNPSPSDYMCLNFEMVREAYAFSYFDEVTNNRYTMFYKSVAYTNIMRNAELRAKNNGWKIHGETDPDFHY